MFYFLGFFCVILFVSGFADESQLGVGAYGIVRKVLDRRAGHRRAMKTINLRGQ